jgi:DNA recombination protein RmuC
MQDALFLLGGIAVTALHLAFAGGGFALGVAVAGLFGARASRERIAAETLAADQAAEVECRLAELGRLQAEMTGRMKTMTEVFGARQADLARGLSERLDGLGHRIGGTLTETGRATHESLTVLAERLAVIDRAQRGIADLSGKMLELKSILANKQARGAFGQGRMEAIVADALPVGSYAFQATLSTGVRPDCLVRLPGEAAALAVDAKFPLESWSAAREAGDETTRDQAMRTFRRDVIRHVADVREKYLVPGETHDVAFLFVPSEAIFADLHEHFADVVARAHRARVIIVSPSLLMLAIQLVQSIGRDAAIRAQADVIQREVGHLSDDVARLGERVAKLQAHFGQAARDLDQIALSADKVVRRAARIESLDLAEPAPPRLAGE